MRRNLNIEFLVNDLQTQIRELKEAQFFGSDSLRLKEYRKTLTIDAGDLTGKLFKITMTPENPESTMPFSFDVLPYSSNQYMNASTALDFSKSGNNFIFYATLQPNYSETSNSCVLKVVYCGKATFTVEEID